MIRLKLLAVSWCVALSLLGCAKTGVFLSVEDYTEPSARDAEYVIRPGDVVNVRVFQQDSMSARSKVRVDGKISLPFLNDVMAAGYTPVVLSAQLQTRLKDFLSNPVVTVSLEEVRQVSVSVLGEVARPGLYVVEPGAGLLHVLAQAGGFTNFAKKDLFVLRQEKPDESPKRLRLDYEKLVRVEGKGPLFRLKANDVVVVE